LQITQKNSTGTSASIRGLDDLRTEVVKASRYHVQSGTVVIDVGCSEGTVLRSVRDANRATRPGVRYLGIDVEPSFESHWRERAADDLEFRFADARSHRFDDASLVVSLFTFQFLPFATGCLCCNASTTGWSRAAR